VKVRVSIVYYENGFDNHDSACASIITTAMLFIRLWSYSRLAVPCGRTRFTCFTGSIKQSCEWPGNHGHGRWHVSPLHLEVTYVDESRVSRYSWLTGPRTSVPPWPHLGLDLDHRPRNRTSSLAVSQTTDSHTWIPRTSVPPWPHLGLVVLGLTDFSTAMASPRPYSLHTCWRRK